MNTQVLEDLGNSRKGEAASREQCAGSLWAGTGPEAKEKGTWGQGCYQEDSEFC